MLTISDVTYRIGPRILFDKASAALPDRARIGFVGRNGAGKTTLMRMIAGEIEPESGDIGVPKSMRIGRVEQEAPGGPTLLVDFVLAADLERSRLLDEAETAADPLRIAEIHTRLVDIDAHAAPSRAASILSGLGFDSAAQQRPLSEFSGGWRMRVALAAVLFSAPDLLLLDEPTNYLDLEGTLWLVDYLAAYPAMVLVISHDRDLLDDVANHILHLDQGKLLLYSGNYSGFEKLRRERQAIEAKAQKKQEDQRKHLQSFVDRFRASAAKARQAQSRLKILAKMEPVSALIDSAVTPFRLPSPDRPLSPPIVAMQNVAAGYGETTILSRLSLSISNDDRIGLLGSNGNGKSTFAKLVAGRIDPMGGDLRRSSKMRVGFFAQHQVDELDLTSTAYSCVAEMMPGASTAHIRSRAAQMGFAGSRADTPVSALSGGEKARLLMGLSSFAGPHLLILDEPTNHLDIDSRAALVEAINDYEGAIILVSHDRRLLEACADRLWLVAGGTVNPFEGDLDDYRRFVLDEKKPSSAGPKRSEEPPQRAPSIRPADTGPRRKDNGAVRRKIFALEERIERFTALVARIDRTLSSPDAFSKDAAKAAELAGQRAELARAIDAAEAEWLDLTSELESAQT